MWGKSVTAAAFIAAITFAAPAGADPGDTPDPGGRWIALVVADGGGGTATADTADAAAQQAMGECTGRGVSSCTVAEVAQGCIAYAQDDSGGGASGSGPTNAVASASARGQLPGGPIVISKCAGD